MSRALLLAINAYAYFLILLIAYGCKQKEQEVHVPVNAAFEFFPPLAKDVTIQPLEDNKDEILLAATFDPKTIKSQFLSILKEGDTIVLHDDGKGGDILRNDNIYSIKLKVDMKQLQISLEAKTAKLQETEPVKFLNRSMARVDTAGARFRFKSFKSKNAISLKWLDPIGSKKLIDHSLMITNLNVVEDPARTWNFCEQTGNVDGPWTFKTLMKNLASSDPNSMASDEQLSEFVKNWLEHWSTKQNVNNETVPERTVSKILDGWKTRSAVSGAEDGFLDMRFAPFKLMAIVNRLDLRGNSGYGFRNAGEGRFVFCLIDDQCTSASQFTVIFEYGIPKSNCSTLKAFAAEWYALKDMDFNTEAYKNALVAITDQFTVAGTSPEKANKASLNQLRTNDFALGRPWELREFTLDKATHHLKQVTVKQEPAVKHNAKLDNADVERLVKFINDQTPQIILNRYTVPNTFLGSDFLGGKSHTEFPPVGETNAHHWNGSATNIILDDQARHIFSLNTCSGCHGGETQTGFTHIDPVLFGKETTLSGFLTGKAGRGAGPVLPHDADGNANDGKMSVKDPAGRPASSPTIRGFNDLKRRANDLESFSTASCNSIFHIRNVLMFDPIRMPH